MVTTLGGIITAPKERKQLSLNWININKDEIIKIEKEIGSTVEVIASMKQNHRLIIQTSLQTV